MKRFITSIQRVTGLTSTEAIAVCAITLVIGIGWIGKALSPPPATHDVATIQRIAAILDSLDVPTREIENSGNREIENSGNRYPTTVTDGKPLTIAPLTNKPLTAKRLVNVNTASRSQLMKLPGVGPATADKIIEHRKSRPFTSVDELLAVKGIGPAKLERMRAFVATP